MGGRVAETQNDPRPVSSEASPVVCSGPYSQESGTGVQPKQRLRTSPGQILLTKWPWALLCTLWHSMPPLQCGDNLAQSHFVLTTRNSSKAAIATGSGGLVSAAAVAAIPPCRRARPNTRYGQLLVLTRREKAKGGRGQGEPSKVPGGDRVPVSLSGLDSLFQRLPHLQPKRPHAQPAFKALRGPRWSRSGPAAEQEAGRLRLKLASTSLHCWKLPTEPAKILISFLSLSAVQQPPQRLPLPGPRKTLGK